jgi:hypothetical protein
MTPDNYLFLFILGVLVIVAYLTFTNKTTPEERDAMLKDKEMWL